jgi:serine/threonine protein kinase
MATIGNYKILKMISEGGFARIYQAEHTVLEELACIKQCKISTEEYTELLRQEAKILWKLNDHHSIPTVKDFFKTKDGGGLMVMNYIDGMSLQDIIPKNTRMHYEDTCWITERLLEAVYYCHYNGVIHGDIKPGNLIVEAKKHDIKLIDFGLAITNPNRKSKPIGFTEAFAAPELLEGKPPIPETDLYGVGITMLYALGGNPIIKSIPDDVPSQIQDFCNALLRYDPMERPSWEKDNLVQRLSDVRQQVFGRRRTEAYSKTSMPK